MKPKFDMKNAERDFSRVLDELQKLPGFDRKKVLTAEAGSILKKCAARTKVAPLAKVEIAAKIRALKSLGFTGTDAGPDAVTINAGKRGPFGRVFIRKKNGKGFRRTHEADFQPINQHYSNAQWVKLQNSIARAKEILPRALAGAKSSAGLARQSWILIADKLGINLAAVPGGGISGRALAEAAKASGPRGRLYPNGTATEEDNQGKYVITLINRLPYGRKIGLDGVLQAAIAGRVSFITASIAKGAFDSMEAVVKRFPQWKFKR